MRIEHYFRRIQDALEDCQVARSFDVTYDKRGTYEGFVRGELYLVDGSTLHFRESVDAETAPQRLAYVYQYMDSGRRLVFRYDNTGHHKRLELSSYPDHKHEGSEHNVMPSSAPTLSQVLREIEDRIAFS